MNENNSLERKILVSVIIPTYNCSNYLLRAVNSVLSQDLKNIEIIIVDDASTDNTQEVLDKNFKYNNLVKIITHSVNKNVGASRNAGIENAIGKYVYFLDSDDWIEKETLQHLSSIAEENCCDIVECGIQKVDSVGNKTKYHSFSFSCNGGEEALEYFSKYNIASTAWNKLYLRSFIKENNLSFTVGYYHEDILFTLEAISFCKKYISIDNLYYNYFVNEKSITNTKLSVLHLESYIKVWLEMVSFFDKKNDFNKEKNIPFFVVQAHCYNDIFNKILKYSETLSNDEWGKQCIYICDKIIGKNGYVVSLFLIEIVKNKELFEEKLSTKINEIELIKTELNSKDNELCLIKTELNSKNEELNLINDDFKLNKKKLDFVSSELSSLYSSRTWRFVVYFRKILNILIPKGGLLRKGCRFLFNLIKKIRNIFYFFISIKNYFIRFKPRKKRKINFKSRKIVFVDHYFHKQTKSSLFVVDYLKVFFDVEIIWDESYKGSEYPDLSFINDEYLAVIFWQSIPGLDILSNIKNDNIIFFPMYDGVRHDYGFWNEVRDLKIINFSDTLHKKIKKWGLDSIYVQYFPEPKDFIPGEKDKVFFWQRLTHFNINTLVKLFKKENVSLHIHKAIDPGHNFIKPSKEIEEKFEITYSDWFDTKEEMWNTIKQKGIYIAPREYEGIGMSFLEAMAMGKAVVAINNPTMNEYIKDGYNGYLFDLKNPKEIDLSNIEQVQKNTHKYIQDGYKKWEENKNKIIKFILKE